MQQPVGPVGRVQVVVEQPGHRLLLLGFVVLSPGPPGRVAADQVVQPVLAVGGLGQQVTVEQHPEGLLRRRRAAAVQRGRGLQAVRRARTGAEAPQEPLMRGSERAIRQVEGGDQLRARGAGAAQPRRGLCPLLDQVVEAGRAGLGDAAGGQLDRERQPPAQADGRGDLIAVHRPALAGDPAEQRDRLIDRQHVEGQRVRAGSRPAGAGW